MARKISIIVISLLASVIIITTLLQLPIDWRLSGVEAPTKRPTLTPAALFDGTTARETDTFLTSKFGFRGFAIRLQHQLTWTFFRQLPSLRGTKIDVGKERWLFEHEYIRHYAKRFPIREEYAVDFADRLLAVKNLLDKENIPFVVCVSPSKANVYPEFTPTEHHPTPETLAYTIAIDSLIPLLRERGIVVVNSTELLLKLKSQNPDILLFPKNGTHWNYYAAQRVADEIWLEAQKQNPSLPNIPSTIGHVNKPLFAADCDLSALYNMLSYPYNVPLTPYPLLSDTPAPERKMKIFGVGDSFSYQLVDAFGRTGAFDQFRLLYYNKAEYLFKYDPKKPDLADDAAKHRVGPIDHSKYDLIAELKNCDLFIFEFNEIFARSYGWDFKLP